MKIHIVRIVLLILIVLCLFMGHKVYTQNEIIYETKEELSRSITGVEASLIHQIKAGRDVMEKQSGEIIEIDNQIKELEKQKDLIWSGYSENYEIVNGMKNSLKDELGLN